MNILASPFSDWNFSQLVPHSERTSQPIPMAVDENTMSYQPSLPTAMDTSGQSATCNCKSTLSTADTTLWPHGTRQLVIHKNSLTWSKSYGFHLKN